jgi:hypothetical protein
MREQQDSTPERAAAPESSVKLIRLTQTRLICGAIWTRLSLSTILCIGSKTVSKLTSNEKMTE